jgi:tetratricopeptide (TPR) repeat protein
LRSGQRGGVSTSGETEVDSIEFYIDQGYCDLAEKSLDDLESEFGARPEIVNLRARLDNVFSTPDTENSDQKPIVAENVHQTEYAPETPVQVENANLPQEPIAPQASQNANAATQINGFGILDDLKNELIAEETPTASAEEDYETHYHLATAYKEMGLMENAIREFQDAINLVEMTDGTRRFFQCANLLGHCFMEKQLPKAAAQWLARCLEVEDLNDEEKHAIYYELGNAFEAGGDREKATNYFERLYAENIDYRDVSERPKNIKPSGSVSNFMMKMRRCPFNCKRQLKQRRVKLNKTSLNYYNSVLWLVMKRNSRFRNLSPARKNC